MARLKSISLFASVFAVFALTACSSGSGTGGESDGETGAGPNGGSGGGSGDGSSSRTGLQFFEGNGKLFAIDPSSPQYQMTIDQDVAPAAYDNPEAGATLYFGADVDDGTATNLHGDRVVYARASDGTLRSVSAETGSGQPTPTQISSESHADGLCIVDKAIDYANPENAAYVYAIGNESCDDSSLNYKMVQVTDDANTAPRDFPGKPVTNLLDPEDGSYSGYLAQDDDGHLTRVAPDMTLEEDFGVASGVRVVDQGEGAAGLIYLSIGGQLKVYKTQDNELVDLGVNTPSTTRMGPKELFYVSNDALYRTDVDKGTTHKIQEPDGDLVGGGTLGVMPDWVVWQFLRDKDNGSDIQTVIRSIDRSDGSSRDLDTFTYSFSGGEQTSGKQAMLFGPAGSQSGKYVFYNVRDLGSGQVKAVAARVDGSDSERYDNAGWIGFSIPDDVASGYILGYSRVFRMDGAGSPSVESVDANNPGGSSFMLGTLPDNVQTASLVNTGSMRLGVGVIAAGSGPKNDILYFEPKQAGSLQRVTETGDIDETIVIDP